MQCLFTQGNLFSCVKYNLDVTVYCSGAIVAAVCDDFRLVVLSL